ncbi:unnamed protein product [Tuber melanosporum]|uniref:(Perigord truffle) hypothetical protein n=1 Tax=Tuber melanosporum (strain Mel28) TaxID=656061 RepID=D5G4T2_TUBMM|nr:uncharacterized protein GSTUM_00000180001 [Tuber melanosporum]CAZ79525.1 unnamed protein product [Tuber melanosporum]
MSTFTTPFRRGNAKVVSEHGSAEVGQVSSSGDEESYSAMPGGRRGSRGKGEVTEGQKPAVEKNPVANSAAECPEGYSIPDYQEIYAKLKDVIVEVRPSLQNMYGKTEMELNERLEVPIKRGEEMARKLIKDMGCSREVAKELTVITLYDVAILIDDSDSMIDEEGGKRKETLVKYIDNITEIYSMAKKSGILAMRFMNGPGGKKDWTGESSQEYLSQHIYGGVTRIGTELKRKILDVFATKNQNQVRPLLVLIVTDGMVEGEKKGLLKKVIRDCVNEREKAGKGFDAVSFQFSRIGNDYGAEELLTGLENDSDLGKFVDVLPIEFDIENQLDKWFVVPKILLGAILPNWGGGSEHDIVKQKNYLAEKEEEDVEDDDWAE